MLLQADPSGGALSEAFLRPLGLAALTALVVLVALYLLEPDPERVGLPTLRFVLADRERSRDRPALRRLRRSLLLLLQALAVVLLATALAGPYVSVSERRTVQETVVVVDASASMATETDGGTRFDAAVAAAREAVAGRTSVVAAGAGPRVLLRRGPPAQARRSLDGLSVTGAPGNLRAAVARATALAGEDARVVVASDFAGESDWRRAVRVARARGLDVTLRQFAGGGRGNVGVVDTTFDDGAVTVAVRNTGDERATRRVSLGDRSASLALAPGDTVTREFPVPAGGGTVRLEPGDGFPLDDAAPVAAPADPTVRTLLLTNEDDRRLRTALSVVDAVDLTVKRPPATVTRGYDLVVFGAVAPGRVLDGSVGVARDTLARGGGVVVQARPNVSRAPYGDLLPVDPAGMGTNATLAEPVRDPLTRDVAFPAPRRYLRGSLERGRALVETTGGSPVLARATVGEGRVLYYGYFGRASPFRYNYLYPVFWKRVAYGLSGRPSLASLNRETGDRLPVAEGATVETPAGSRTGPVVLDRVGRYDAGGRTYAAALLSPAESAVRAAPVDAGPDAVPTGRTETATVPFDLTPLVAALAALVVVLELVVLRYRGDL